MRRLIGWTVLRLDGTALSKVHDPERGYLWTDKHYAERALPGVTLSHEDEGRILLAEVFIDDGDPTP